MSIALKCRCGRHMKVKDTKAGKKVRCPSCGQGVRVPVADPKTDDQIKALKDWVKDTDKVQREAGRATAVPTTKSPRGMSATPLTPLPEHKTAKSKPKPAETKEADSFLWVYLGALGGVLLLGGLVWLIWFR